MIKGLYDSFAERFYHGGTVYFYSDPHFGDEEMKYLRKNYIGDMDQVKSINKVLGKNDTIIFLGDIGDINYIKYIKGYKVLIMGNHDAGISNYKRAVVDGVDNHLFDEVYEGALIIGPKLIISHEPVEFPFAFNIHGHDHSGIFKSDKKDHLNVCAELIDYTPVCLSKIIKSGILKDVTDIHRCAIDRQIAHKALTKSK